MDGMPLEKSLLPSAGVLAALLLAGCELAPPAPALPCDLHGQLRMEGAEPAPWHEQQVLVSALPLDRARPRASGQLVLHASLRATGTDPLVLPFGQEICFRNDDAICHQYFSSSAGNAFELGLLGPGAAKRHRPDQPGFIRIYCSLHADEQATVLVLPASRFALVAPDGSFTIPALEPGLYRLEVWAAGRAPQAAEWLVSRDVRSIVEIPVAAARPAAPK